MTKLIRDGYQKSIDTNKLSKVQSKEELISYLTLKIKEELNEIIESDYKDIEEYADIIECIYSLAMINDILPNDIEKARIKKKMDKGGFEKGLILELDVDHS